MFNAVDFFNTIIIDFTSKWKLKNAFVNLHIFEALQKPVFMIAL